MLIGKTKAIPRLAIISPDELFKYLLVGLNVMFSNKDLNKEADIILTPMCGL